jgi:hypothetical protein
MQVGCVEERSEMYAKLHNKLFLPLCVPQTAGGRAVKRRVRCGVSGHKIISLEHQLVNANYLHIWR